MFGKQHTLKQLFGGIAIAAFLAVVAVPSAFAGSFITDTLGGNGYPKATPDAFERAVAIHEAWQVRAQQARTQQAQGMTFITDTLGGNGSPKATPQGMTFITDTLGGNGSPKATPDVFERAVAIHEAQQAQSQARAVLLSQAQVWGTRVITDTLGGNGYPATNPSYNPGAYVNGGMSPEVAKSIQAHHYDPSAYVNGGATPAVAQAIQDLGNGVTPSAPSVTGGSSGTSFNWSDAGIGAGLAAGLLLLLAWGARLRTHNRRRVLTV
jgi:hypothetical protein